MRHGSEITKRQEREFIMSEYFTRVQFESSGFEHQVILFDVIHRELSLQVERHDVLQQTRVRRVSARELDGMLKMLKVADFEPYRKDKGFDQPGVAGYFEEGNVVFTGISSHPIMKINCNVWVNPIRPYHRLYLHLEKLVTDKDSRMV